MYELGKKGCWKMNQWGKSMTISFEFQERECEEWCKENEGYVFNFFGGTDRNVDMNKILHVNCRYLWRETDEGKRTTSYKKVCSMDLEELLTFVEKERGRSFSYCRSCM
jgi:hypothetical protein